MSTLDVVAGVASVFRRHSTVYSRGWRHSLLTTFKEPLLYLISFVIGVTSLVPQVTTGGQSVSYRAFVFSGIVTQSVLYQGFFSAAYGRYSRMHQQRLFVAILTTPVTLREVLWAELLWNAARGSLAAACILLVGTLSGDFLTLGALAALPLCFVAALIFSALEMSVAALARNFNELSNAQFYVVFPCFLLSGVLFPLDGLPDWARALAGLLPLTPVLDLLRGELLGVAVAPRALWLLAAWTGGWVLIASWAMTRRLVK